MAIPERRTSDTAGPPGAYARERAELEALHQTALGLIERLDLESVLRAIVERAGSLVGTEHGYLYCRDGPDALRAHVGTGMFGFLAGYRLALGDGLAGRVAAEGRPLVVTDYRAWAGSHPELTAFPSRAVVGVPLFDGRDVVGVLGLAHHEEGRTFGEPEIDLLTRFARLAALALDNARLYESAQSELARRRNTEEELLDTIARLRRSERALRQAHDETIRRLGYVAEFRNAETGKHIERMSRLCVLLGQRLGLDDDECELLRAASPLHDLGKIAISDEILLKPGPLDPQERTVVQRHAEIGYRLLSGSSSDLLELAAEIAHTHHERFDGTGYPRGLAGQEIPLAGRIASVADVFDALTSDRPYRAALPLEETLELMREGRGTQFDPLVLDTLLQSIPELVAAGDEQGWPPAGENEPRTDSASRSARDLDAEPLPAGPVEAIDPERLRQACRRAGEALAQRGPGRQAIEEAFSELVSGLEDWLLVSVYVEEHGRLWLITQRGYREVLDGFSLHHGVMARAVRSGESQFVPDSRADPDFVEATAGILSEVTVPFGSPDASFRGALNLETVGATLPREAVEIVDPLARAIGECLAAMRGGLAVDVPTLARLCVHASSLRGTSAIAEFAARTVGRLLDLDCVQLDLRPDGGMFTLASFWRRESFGLEPLPPTEVHRLAVAEHESRVGATYHQFDLRQVRAGSQDVAAPWIVWFPLTVAGGALGAIVGRASEHLEFDQERVEAATLFAQHTAALIDVSLALRREQRAAVTDALTGLLNRRGFDERLREELDRAAHAGTSVTLVLADCDDLKAINDRGGHELGDRVLQSFAQCLRTNRRPHDATARIGGDEFAILLPDTTPDEGALVAERLRRELRNLPVDSEIPVVATFGVATYPEDGHTAADLLRTADRALYAAKRAGDDPAIARPASAA